jgi:hypothetical protein
MNFKLEFAVDNAAFAGPCDGNYDRRAIADQLRAVAAKVEEEGGYVTESEGDRGLIRDVNGNSVGIWVLA